MSRNRLPLQNFTQTYFLIALDILIFFVFCKDYDSSDVNGSLWNRFRLHQKQCIYIVHTYQHNNWPQPQKKISEGLPCICNSKNSKWSLPSQFKLTIPLGDILQKGTLKTMFINVILHFASVEYLPRDLFYLYSTVLPNIHPEIVRFRIGNPIKI